MLDPEQNSTFRDHYLDVPFDLSRVLFITTANMLDPIPAPFRDRMEIIELPGYTEDEKVQIARRHLVPKQAIEHGLELDRDITFTEPALRLLVRSYTREAGVRSLEREIAALYRKTARRRAEGDLTLVTVDPERRDRAPRVATVPRRGGDRRADPHPRRRRGARVDPDRGRRALRRGLENDGGKSLTLTGQLGDVMKESAQAAVSWVRAHAAELGIAPDFWMRSDLHLHVPAGAIPKDGPSAGVTLATALVSLLRGQTIRPGLAMTGEVTLSGRVLPVGGIKEKVLAAHRVGLTTLILPRQNERQLLEDVPAEVRARLEVHLVRDVAEVLQIALPDASHWSPLDGELELELAGKGTS